MKEYIEREALLEVVTNLRLGRHLNKESALNLMERAIDNLPAADVVERKRGEWEWFEEWNPSTPDHPRECEDCGWRCGKCKTSLEDVVGGYWDDPTEKPKLNFCPICGADMRGENNG